MWVSIYFDVYNNPIINLTPTIRIRDILDGSVVDSGVMTEVGDGFYTYGFAYDKENSLRTCFKQNIDRTQPLNIRDDSEYPNNATYLKMFYNPSDPPEKCTGYTTYNDSPSIPCNYIYNQKSKNNSENNANTWCSNADGCTLQQN